MTHVLVCRTAAVACPQVRVRGVEKYNTFKELVAHKGADAILPDCEGDEESALNELRNMQTTRGTYGELEEDYGAIAIDLEALSGPPSPTF